MGQKIGDNGLYHLVHIFCLCDWIIFFSIRNLPWEATVACCACL